MKGARLSARREHPPTWPGLRTRTTPRSCVSARRRGLLPPSPAIPRVRRRTRTRLRSRSSAARSPPTRSPHGRRPRPALFQHPPTRPRRTSTGSSSSGQPVAVTPERAAATRRRGDARASRQQVDDGVGEVCAPEGWQGVGRRRSDQDHPRPRRDAAGSEIDLGAAEATAVASAVPATTPASTPPPRQPAPPPIRHVIDPGEVDPGAPADLVRPLPAGVQSKLTNGGYVFPRLRASELRRHVRRLAPRREGRLASRRGHLLAARHPHCWPSPPGQCTPSAGTRSAAGGSGYATSWATSSTTRTSPPTRRSPSRASTSTPVT